MEIDEFGRIYVVENPAYPLEVEGKLGRVKLLQDTDDDGRPDHSTVFADGLTMPTGVMRWKKGILVTDAPNVWYFEDSDGDDRADVRRVVLTGFAFSNPQHTVSNPIFGPDNWVYLANERPVETHIFPKTFGDKGSDIRFPDHTDVAGVAPRGRSIRLRPDTYHLEALSSTSQFGHTFDDWGHYFTIRSGGNGYHEVIAAHYLERKSRPAPVLDKAVVESLHRSFSDHRTPGAPDAHLSRQHHLGLRHHTLPGRSLPGAL